MGSGRGRQRRVSASVEDASGRFGSEWEKIVSGRGIVALHENLRRAGGADPSVDGGATALVVQDCLGGEILETTVDDTPHYLNRLVNGQQLDFSEVHLVTYEKSETQKVKRDEVEGDEATNMNYIALKQRLVHYHAMEAALATALESHDPSTQNGAVVLDVNGNIVAADNNRFPNGIAETPERWERPLKYNFIEHAERNAIFTAARNGTRLEDSTLVCPWAACSDCARAIVQAGVKTLVRIPRRSDSAGGQWKEEVAIGDVIMREAGIEIIELDPAGIPDPGLRRAGKVFSIHDAYTEVIPSGTGDEVPPVVPATPSASN